MKGIILIAHGSKKESSNNEFITMVETIKQQSNYDFTQAAFLEIATPSIQMVANSFIQQGAKEIVFYPFFLNSGKHVLNDIPKIIEELKTNHNNVVFKLLEHFGSSSKINDIILNDIQ